MGPGSKRKALCARRLPGLSKRCLLPFPCLPGSSPGYYASSAEDFYKACLLQSDAASTSSTRPLRPSANFFLSIRRGQRGGISEEISRSASHRLHPCSGERIWQQRRDLLRFSMISAKGEAVYG